MKIAQEIRAGNVIMLNGNPMVVQKTEYNKSGRNAAVVKMKLKSLLFSVLMTASMTLFLSVRTAPTPTSTILSMYSWTKSTTSTTLRRTTWATF